jgi:hypothetical protein
VNGKETRNRDIWYYVIHFFKKYFLFKNILKYYFIKSILSKRFKKNKNYISKKKKHCDNIPHENKNITDICTQKPFYLFLYGQAS